MNTKVFNLSTYIKKAELEDYKEKRDFDVTPEPKAEAVETTSKVFLVQRHEAKRAGLHYDLRLEDNGVLKSWAVRKGMPPKGTKHLAIAVEDHPYNYKDFEGTIPEGYGAGTVTIDAQSEFKTIEKTDGKWKFEVLDGKYKGVWSLVRMRDNQWLIMSSQ